MKCEFCGRREAALSFVEVGGGQKTRRWICAECAEKEGVMVEEVSALPHGTLSTFLDGIFPQVENEDDIPPPPVDSCPECDCAFEQLQTGGKLGCPACYRAFRPQLLPLLRRYHGQAQHVGKLPAADDPRMALRREIGQIKAQLEEAVALEEFEEAARLRDLINEREQETARLTDSAGAEVDDAPSQE